MGWISNTIPEGVRSISAEKVPAPEALLAGTSNRFDRTRPGMDRCTSRGTKAQGDMNPRSRCRPHPGIVLISSIVQYFRILSAPNSRTSSSKCFHNTLPNPSRIDLTSSRLKSFSPLLQADKYPSSLSSPAWISRCCCIGPVVLVWLNTGIRCPRKGKIRCSSMS